MEPIFNTLINQKHFFTSKNVGECYFSCHILLWSYLLMPIALFCQLDLFNFISQLRSKEMSFYYL